LHERATLKSGVSLTFNVLTLPRLLNRPGRPPCFVKAFSGSRCLFCHHYIYRRSFFFYPLDTPGGFLSHVSCMMVWSHRHTKTSNGRLPFLSHTYTCTAVSRLQVRPATAARFFCSPCLWILLGMGVFNQSRYLSCSTYPYSCHNRGLKS
jgi:hypothetical protein